MLDVPGEGFQLVFGYRVRHGTGKKRVGQLFVSQLINCPKPFFLYKTEVRYQFAGREPFFYLRYFSPEYKKIRIGFDGYFFQDVFLRTGNDNH